ncbi:P-loop containing nucleoside triphosphate hydrolase protein [Acephala macrosclerotiorum]|nr:P-loop containing nucleoside triphosphate hydrolase protein [Acephala macrosclerotiorum]
MLYPANSAIYTNEEGRFRAYVVAELSGMDARPSGRYGQLQIRAWAIDHNGKYFTKRYHTLAVSQFAGEKEIVNLKYIPAGYLPNEASVRAELILRGKKYWKLGSEIRHMKYRLGLKTNRIVIDQSSRPIEVPPPEQEFEDQFPVTMDFNLKPLMLVICPSVISAFVLRDLQWATVNIDDIKPIEFEKDIMEKLVLPKREKNLLFSAMRSNAPAANESRRRYDSGDATIVLLHGAPGLGKTVTTKYLAEHLRRPLISFSAGDLGATPDVVDANLAQYLRRAERWSAILAMENADVILAQRTKTDVVRNAVVMTFQRALDNYTEPLILTTTRVGSLDESIEARVQVAIHYRELDAEGRRQIWQTIIQEASENHRVDTDDLWEHLSDLVKKRLNGKEYRVHGK